MVIPGFLCGLHLSAWGDQQLHTCEILGTRLEFASVRGFLFASFWFCWVGSFAAVWVGSGGYGGGTGVLDTQAWTLLQAAQSALPTMLGGLTYCSHSCLEPRIFICVWDSVSAAIYFWLDPDYAQHVRATRQVGGRSGG